MSDDQGRGAFWDHFDKGGVLNDDTTQQDGSYQPWTTTGHSSKPIKLDFVPAKQEECWRIPYLQTIIHRYDPKTGQLCLMFPSSNVNVFIEGRGLKQLDDLIEVRSVKTVTMFDEDIHQPVAEDAPIVTNIRFEQSS